ncbi:Skb1 methyltransferase [Xylona heveae TC161]|uniref:Skb1 methyltransferase n=1 Tax=Xylona heveae (strain CBS 132557 / TC161) TaxID=1328760 RepID=A0A164ZST7_XYLHT|nr:Skb1 methyltransferase [Xylona heveae TC161]KZF19464.1 Skb1 methyltransferase [Xylona heveae TC161]
MASAGYDEHYPTFYIGQHETQRSLPVTDEILRQAQAWNYDMLTTPITTPYFHSRVLTLLSNYLSELSSLSGDDLTLSSSNTLPSNLSDVRPPKSEPPAPVIPSLSPVDTPLTPNDTISQIIACASSWIDLASPDPLIANISRQVLNLEMAYAAFCGVGNIVIPGPRLHHQGRNTGEGIAQYARAVQEALAAGPFLQVLINLPMVDQIDAELDEDVMGSLAPFARDQYTSQSTLGSSKPGSKKVDMFGTWDAWHIIRTMCKYNSRLSVVLNLPRHHPPAAVQSRWLSEPVRIISIHQNSFLKNSKGYPVLSKANQNIITRFMRLRTPPWFLLSDVGPIPGFELNNNPQATAAAAASAAGFLSPSATADAAGGVSKSPSPGASSPTPAEAAAATQQSAEASKRSKDPTPHLSYMRHLQRNQPAKTPIERFGAGYQDYLQAPLQPLADNLESITYEVFEKDPIKYEWYERAITRALRDWVDYKKPMSGPRGRSVVIAVVGAGRGPLVTRALRASEAARVPVDVWAVEKNQNAYVLLQRHNEEDWGGCVHVVKSDMRAWKGPWWDESELQEERGTTSSSIPEEPELDEDDLSLAGSSGFGVVDILVSELLGSFADNELSPECLDGVQHVLNPMHGISIPSSYTAHLTPISAPKLHADIALRTPADSSAPETPYVVMLHAIDFLSTTAVATEPTAAQEAEGTGTPSIPPALNASAGSGTTTTFQPNIKIAWEFEHPAPTNTLLFSQLRKGGGIQSGGGGLAGGDGANEHNARFAKLSFRCKDRGVCHGLGGYFETVLYDDVELSTNPVSMAHKSKDMISWFPIYFPLKAPIYFPDHSELDVSIWRQTDDRKVWYEWMVEAFVLLGEKRVRLGVSDLHSSKKNGCLM